MRMEFSSMLDGRVEAALLRRVATAVVILVAAVGCEMFGGDPNSATYVGSAPAVTGNTFDRYNDQFRPQDRSNAFARPHGRDVRNQVHGFPNRDCMGDLPANLFLSALPRSKCPD